MGASWIGVYLLAYTDTRDLTRALAFALLCGFAWKPVFDAGTAFIEMRKVIKAENKIAALEEATANLSTDGNEEQVEAVIKLAKEALRSASTADRRSLDRRVTQTVTRLARLADPTAARPEATEFLAQVGEVAIASGYPDAAKPLALALRDVARARADNETQVAASFKAIDQMSATAAREAPEAVPPFAVLGAETALVLTKKEEAGGEVGSGEKDATSQIAEGERRELLGRALVRLETPHVASPEPQELRGLDGLALETRLHAAMAAVPGGG